MNISELDEFYYWKTFLISKGIFLDYENQDIRDAICLIVAEVKRKI